ncbi:MAG: hypothetical protein K6E84_09290 [Lachnospiraceae bacterium]|nr:hypothetical protein [Lachnospiraceae bacterium]
MKELDENLEEKEKEQIKNVKETEKKIEDDIDKNLNINELQGHPELNQDAKDTQAVANEKVEAQERLRKEEQVKQQQKMGIDEMAKKEEEKAAAQNRQQMKPPHPPGPPKDPQQPGMQQPNVVMQPVQQPMTVEQMQQQMIWMQQQMMQMQQTIQMQQMQLAGVQPQQMQPQQMQQPNMQNMQMPQQQQQMMQQNQQNPQMQPRRQKNPAAITDPMDTIRRKLQHESLRYEKIAKDATGKDYAKKRVPGNVGAKYYYAAVRDYHKDILKKMKSLPTEELQKKYYAKYYNQETINSYVLSRAKDPVYRHMVDTYKQSQVMESYEKFRHDRRHPADFGYAPYGKDAQTGNARAYQGFNTKSYLYEKEGTGKDSVWEEFRQEMEKYNELCLKQGTEAVTPGMVQDQAERLREKADLAILTYDGDWRGRGKPFVAEAKKVKTYLDEVDEYGPEAAALRRTCREKIEKGENLKAGLKNQQEAADYLVAKKLMNPKNPHAKQFWDQFKAETDDPEMRYGKAVSKIDNLRSQTLRDPAFSVALQSNSSMKSFEKTYNQMVQERGVKEIGRRDKEVYRQHLADETIRKREQKEREKEESTRKSERKKLDQLKSLGR